MEEKIYDTAQVAARLRCSQSHVVTLIRTGRLKGFDIGAGSKQPRWRIPEQSLLDFIRTGEDGLVGRMHTR